jgi:hypothetical protein
MKKNLSMTIVLIPVLVLVSTLLTGFSGLRESSSLQPLKGFLKDGKMIVRDACEDIVYGYYTISGGSSNPNFHNPWNDCTSGYAIHGLDPRTVQVYPSFGGGGTYTFTKLSSNPSTITLGTTSSSCYFTFNNWGDVITIQVSKGGVTKVVSFYFTS